MKNSIPSRPGGPQVRSLFITLSRSIRFLLALTLTSLYLPFGYSLLAADIKSTVSNNPIPVILDTDIGDDIDDTWALVMLLKSPQFDLKLVTTTTGKAEYRAKLIAKLLTIAGRTDVPVGLGAGGIDGVGGQQEWVKDYRLNEYPGKIANDGVQAMIDTIQAHAKKQEPITLIAIGPLQTVSEALKRDPSLASKTRFVGMHGSVRKGYNNSPTPCVEYNMTYVPGAKTVFSAPWQSATITPLDTCGLVALRGNNYSSLRESKDELVQALLENYRLWAAHGKPAGQPVPTASSILFDTVAVYLAQPGPKTLLELEPLNITVDDKGMTLIDPVGAKMSVATAWKNLEQYHELLVKTLRPPTLPKK